ncbi:MAG: glutamate--tRNA ligase, partial [Nanoarchaeota archaeon]|nr:glutamate--tRNA ligase [Nanoarchaeota archaeon]
MNIENEIKKFALENAIKFKGKANKKAVISKVLGLGPDIKNDMKNITGQIDKILEEVNALDLDSQKQELLKLNPDFETEQKEKKAAQKQAAEELPPLKNAVMGKVITRMPPEPSKYSHVGHALSFLINYMYAQNYQGQCILRFEDTNPEKESKEFADAIKGDVLDYLDIKPSKTLYASDDMDKFYKLADQLVQSNHAYVCSCPSEQISKDRRAMTECPHRMQRLDLNMKLWKEMLQGKSKEYVLRLLIDMRHKNAVMRDPVIFRVIDQEHYRQKSKFKVWPMYDFENAVEDGLCKVTHVMRSNEFDTRIELQTYILRLLGMPEIEYKHYGRFNITGALTQGRKIREGIEKGEFVGWDDPRLVTLKALKRRGIVKETLYKLAKTCGMSKTQSNIDYSVIASINRNILDA